MMTGCWAAAISAAAFATSVGSGSIVGMSGVGTAASPEP
jgi:hypothetical protein